MPTYTRNVQIYTTQRRHSLERILLANPVLNRMLSWSAQIALSALIWPRFVAPHRLTLTRYDLPLPGLDSALDGYRILQLTDLHVGKTRLSYLQRAIDRCLAEKPDLIVLTGDLIDYHPDSLPPLGPLLQHIVQHAGRDGVIAIFGNHDYHEYSWRHIGPRSAHRSIHKRLVRIVKDSGIRLLRNQHHTIARGVGRLTLVGLDEMWTGRADAAAAFRDVPPDVPIICLQHNPDGIDFLRPYPWQYMLCGHSHGGQACFPILGPLYVPMVHRQYLQGHFEFSLASGKPGTRTMFVSRGMGYSTPIRWNCPPEATIFTLRLASSMQAQQATS